MSGIIESMNEYIHAYAEKKGITVTEALLEFKKNFVTRSEVADTALGRGGPKPPVIIDQGRQGEFGDMAAFYESQAKVELKKLELEERRIETERKKAENEERKFALEERKVESAERLAREKADREETYHKDEMRIERERASTERTLLFANLSGKKGDDLTEYLKSQGERDKDIYKTLLDSKDNERDREMEWKKALAEIEAKRETDLAKIRQEKDAGTASQTEVLIETLGEKFDKFIEVTKGGSGSSPDDWTKKFDDFQKIQDGVVRASMGILKARGFSEEQLKTIDSAVSSEKERQTSTLDKLWDLGKKVWKEIEPHAEQAKRELDAVERAPSGFEKTGTGISKAEEERIRRETEEKAKRLQFDNASLEEEKKRLLAQRERRRALEARAIEIGIVFDPAATSDEQLINAIQNQELLISQVLQEREKLILKANELGIAIDPAATNEQIFDVVEQAEALRDRERREKEEEAKSIAALHENEKAGPAKEEPKEEKSPRADAIPEIKPRAERIAEKMEKPKKKPAKKAGELQKFLITKIDGMEVGEIEAGDAKGAALKVAKSLDGTREAPIRIKVTERGTGREFVYDTFTIERAGKEGKMFKAPMIKGVKE